MIAVKICGLRSADDALKATAAGADMLGFVFAPSKRQVPPAIARQAIAEVKNMRPNNPPKCVGVFVNDSPAKITEIAAFAGLDIIQLSGDEDPVFAAGIALPVLKAVRLGAHGIRDVLQTAERYSKLVPGVRFVFDSSVPGHYGGTGVVGDWKTAAEVARCYPVILAGGLAPENVADAIRTVRPLAVDVSSGVETNGIKDGNKIDAFVLAAKAGRYSDEESN